MELCVGDGRLVVRGLAFDARLTLMDCAQAFHWLSRADGYCAVCAGREAHLRERPGGFELTCAPGDETYWQDYFDLDRDYAALIDACRPHPAAAKALALLPGLRVLNQDVWETLVAFILSANNNTGRIRKLVEGICLTFGEYHPRCGLFGFPTPEALARAGVEALRGIGCGYRAEYLWRTARLVADGFPLAALRTLSYEQAHGRLLALPGVGDKVADCVLLFGCGHSEAFPVDVWVKRLMRAWFLPGTPSRRAMVEAAQAMFGPHAGLVQQAMFHCARMGLMDVNSKENG